MEVDPQTMRDTLRLWASGVSVVTSVFEGQRVGMTVSAFTSVSLEPPLVLICLQKDTITAELTEKAGIFSVSILGDDQSFLSNRFAGRLDLADGEDRFDGVTTAEAVSGAPILSEAIAWLDCRVHATYKGGTHWVIIGYVLAAGYQEGGVNPLVYFDRSYRAVVPLEEKAGS